MLQLDEKRQEFMVTSVTVDMVFMGISMSVTRRVLWGWHWGLWQQMEVTQPGGNLWGKEMTQAKTHCQCDLAHPLSCQLHPLVYDTLDMDCTTVYFTTQPA